MIGTKYFSFSKLLINPSFQQSCLRTTIIKQISTSSYSSPNLLYKIPLIDVCKRYTSSKGSPLSPLSPITPSSQPNVNTTNNNSNTDSDQSKREAQWRSMKVGLSVIGFSTAALITYFIYQYGPPQRDEKGNVIHDEFMGLPLVQQYSKRIWKQLIQYNKMIVEPSREKLLPDPVPYPYYQPPYTLLLEFRDLLVHPEWTYNTGWRFKKRPYVDEFFETLNGLANVDRNNLPLFEVVIFTSESGMSIAPILEALDKENKYIYYKLFRDSTEFQDGDHVKNLDMLNRDLKKVIAVDWNHKSLQKNKENALIIPRWDGSDDDTTLQDLAVFLRTIAVNGVDDVREVMLYYSQFDDPIMAFKENQIKLKEQQQEFVPPKTSRLNIGSLFRR